MLKRNHIEAFLDNKDSEGENREFECWLIFVRQIKCLWLTDYLERLRKVHTLGKNKEIAVDIRWHLYLWNINTERARKACRHFLEPVLILITIIHCKNLNYIEENSKIPKGKTKMGFWEIILSNEMWNWECWSTVEQYQEMCVRNSESFGWKEERSTRKPRISSEMISKMDKQRLRRNINIDEGRKNYTKLRKE